MLPFKSHFSYFYDLSLICALKSILCFRTYGKICKSHYIFIKIIKIISAFCSCLKISKLGMYLPIKLEHCVSRMIDVACVREGEGGEGVRKNYGIR